MSSRYNPFRSFAADESGTFVVMTALAAPLFVLLVSGLISYSQAVTVKEITQAAADAAVLAAVNALDSGKVTTVSEAQKVAYDVFYANAPQDTLANQTAMNISVTPLRAKAGEQTVSASIRYESALPSPLGALPIQVAAASSAQVSLASSEGGTQVKGTARSWGDPHIIGANGDSYEMKCEAGSWYSIYRDAHMTINGICHPLVKAFYIGEIALVIDGRQIFVPVANRYDRSKPFSTWNGQVTVDGSPYNPKGNGSFTLVDDPQGEIVLKDVVSGPGQSHLEVTTHGYFITISYDPNNYADISIHAGNAQACQLPGGFLGQTFGPTADHTSEPFKVYGAWDLPAFAQYASSCGTDSKINLIQAAKLTR